MSHLITASAPRGFAGYFWSMLSDVPRGEDYFRAIDAMCAEFVRVEGRRPIVVDVGCGTGMLTLMAYMTGRVERVYGVDVNPDVLHVAKRNARDAGAHGGVHFVLVDPKKGLPDTVPRPDALISEILGTLINSEDAHKYVTQYARLLNPHPSGAVYIVPRRATQLMKHRVFSHVPPGLRVAVEDGLEAAWKEGSWCPTNENGLSVLLHAFPCVEAASAVVRSEEYDRLPPTVSQRQGTLRLAADSASSSSSSLDLLLFEWEVELWRDVVLYNTVEALRAMSATVPSSALARDSAWGFIAVPAFAGETVKATTSGVGLTVAVRQSLADGPPADYRDGAVGSVLADVRFAADVDYVERLVAAFAAWAGPDGLARSRVVVVDDPTSGVLLHHAVQALGPLSRGVGALHRKGKSYYHTLQAYPELADRIQLQTGRGWLSTFAAEPHVLVLAANRLHERGAAANAAVYRAHPTFPPPTRDAPAYHVDAMLPDEHFASAEVPGVEEAGVHTLAQTSGKKFPVAYNLFPSLAFLAVGTVAETLEGAREEGAREEGAGEEEVLLVPAASGTPVRLLLKECDAPPTLPSSNLACLLELGARNAAARGVFHDQLSIVARATASDATERFHFHWLKAG